MDLTHRSRFPSHFSLAALANSGLALPHAAGANSKPKKAERRKGTAVGPSTYGPSPMSAGKEGEAPLTLSQMTFPPCPSSPAPTITLLTHSTPQRLHLVPHLCALYPHPITLVVHSESEYSYSKPAQCDNLKVLYHLSAGPYPVNVLRNILIKSVSTGYYLMIDVDFLPSADLYKRMSSNLPKSGWATVVPAFETVGNGCEGAECEGRWKDVPLDMEGIRARLGKDVRSFQAGNNVGGHSTTNSDRWVKREGGTEVIDCFERYVRKTSYERQEANSLHTFISKTPPRPLPRASQLAVRALPAPARMLPVLRRALRGLRQEQD